VLFEQVYRPLATAGKLLLNLAGPFSIDVALGKPHLEPGIVADFERLHVHGRRLWSVSTDNLLLIRRGVVLASLKRLAAW
jgi:hypothetical protein